jgi:hypothetical protein
MHQFKMINAGRHIGPYINRSIIITLEQAYKYIIS